MDLFELADLVEAAAAERAAVRGTATMFTAAATLRRWAEEEAKAEATGLNIWGRRGLEVVDA